SVFFGPRNIARRAVHHGAFRQWAIGCLAFVAMPFVGTSGADAQWRLTTPRDTIYVPANQPSPTHSKIYQSSYVQTDLVLTKTFGAFSGQNGTGFDARYTYSVPNWNAPYPLANPPSFHGTSYEIYLA